MGHRREMGPPANLQLLGGYPSSLSNNLMSMDNQFDGVPPRGKRRDTGSTYYQQPRQTCSTGAYLSEYSKKDILLKKQNYSKFSGACHGYSNVKTWDADRSYTCEIEKLPRNTLRVDEVGSKVDEVGSNDDRSKVKSKYIHGKRFVQRLLEVLRCERHKENKINEQGAEQPTSNEDLGKAQQFHHTTSVNCRGVGKFHWVNFDSSRSEWRKNPDRWVTVSALCQSLESMCQKNRPWGETRRSMGNIRFKTPNMPYIPLAVYLKRIAWFFECSKECFVIALEYIHQLVRVRSDVKVNYTTVRQLIVAALRLSSKFNDDKFTRNSYYAHIVDLPTSTVAVFEAQMLFFLKFDLNVRPEQYYARYATMLADNQGPTKVTIWPGGN